MNPNTVVITGTLTDAPELRYSPHGLPHGSFGLAVPNANGKVCYHHVVVHGAGAESCRELLGKGSRVQVEGSWRSRRFMDGEGTKCWLLEIWADRVRFLDAEPSRT